MNVNQKNQLYQLDLSKPIWERFYTVAPLVIVGSKGKEAYDLAPKHLAMPLGWDNYFCFVCTPEHQTYKNIVARREFSVSFINPNEAVLASLAASPRCEVNNENKEIVAQLPTFHTKQIDALFMQNSYLYLECNLHEVHDGFGRNSLIIGTVIEALVDSNSLITSDADEAELIKNSPLMVYLPPNRFAMIEESISFPFPKNFKK